MKQAKMMKKSCLTLVLMMVMLFAMSITASAETVGVTGLTQTDATKTGGTVSWNPSASAYLVYVNGQLVSQQAETSYAVSGMVAGGYAELAVIGYNAPLEVDAATVYSYAAQGVPGYSGSAIYVYSTLVSQRMWQMPSMRIPLIGDQVQVMM